MRYSFTRVWDKDWKVVMCGFLGHVSIGGIDMRVAEVHGSQGSSREREGVSSLAAYTAGF